MESLDLVNGILLAQRPFSVFRVTYVISQDDLTTILGDVCKIAKLRPRLPPESRVSLKSDGSVLESSPVDLRAATTEPHLLHTLHQAFGKGRWTEVQGRVLPK